MTNGEWRMTNGECRMTWEDGTIEGCVITPLRKFGDERGWLGEFFREDELADELHPAMGYVSEALPGVARGPHEHAEQTDLFLFFSETFRVYLWDARRDSATYEHRKRIEARASKPMSIIIPPGVVHAYRNVSKKPALVINCPNRLYAGEGKREPVDEIRHEDDAESPFVLD